MGDVGKQSVLTAALVRAMVAVHAGKVTQRYTAVGNTFQGPPGIAPHSYRRLAAMRFIEDAPGQKSSAVYAQHFKQRLNAAGRAAFGKATGASDV